MNLEEYPEELRKWKRLADEHTFRREPFYVTRAELEVLRQLPQAEPHVLELGMIGQFTGIPVIVDEEKARLRPLRWLSERK
jgi:hypothetical protein